MIDWFTSTAGTLGAYPVLQGLIAALCAFVLEDPTTIACGLLVADRKLAFLTALIGVSAGIALGDLGLYWIGRMVGPKTVSWGLISPHRMEKARSLFDRNLILAMVISRFMPGMRLPTYMGAGVFGASARRFLMVAVAASLVWTFLLLSATLKLGEAVLPLLGDFKWPAAVLFVVAFLVARSLAGRAFSDEQTEDLKEEPKIVSNFEFWPPVLFYLPVVVYYLFLSLRHRDPALPTASNPSIYSGGFVGESKSSILDLVPEQHRKWLCRYVVFEKPSSSVSIDDIESDVSRLLAESEVQYPFVAKPDIGQRGAGVQLIRDRQQLSDYIAEFPEGESIIFQEYAAFPNEMGILYYRYPGEEEGQIFSITLKEFPVVVGDGKHTLRQLILNDPRASIVQAVYFERFENDLDSVLAVGEEFDLVFAGNHCQGAIFRDGKNLITDSVLSIVHGFAAELPEFYFGRFDIRFSTIEDFAQGKDSLVVEINGAGAEATHIWDAKATLWDAYKTLFEQFRILFEIGKRNKLRGFPSLGVVELVREFFRYRKLADKYPRTG